MISGAGGSASRDEYEADAASVPSSANADNFYSLTRIQVVPLEPPTERPTFPLDHPYVELVYTPLVGASAVLFLRRMARLLSDHPASVEFDAIVVARELGLRVSSDEPLGINSSLLRAIRRLQHFGVVLWLRPGVLAVFREAPAVGDEHVVKLPESARRAHQHGTKR